MKDDFPQDLVKLISYAVDKKIYGSIEVYFEEGRITQITQRIINKIGSKQIEKKMSSFNSQITRKK